MNNKTAFLVFDEDCEKNKKANALKSFFHELMSCDIPERQQDRVLIGSICVVYEGKAVVYGNLLGDFRDSETYNEVRRTAMQDPEKVLAIMACQRLVSLPKDSRYVDNDYRISTKGRMVMLPVKGMPVEKFWSWAPDQYRLNSSIEALGDYLLEELLGYYNSDTTDLNVDDLTELASAQGGRLDAVFFDVRDRNVYHYVTYVDSFTRNRETMEEENNRPIFFFSFLNSPVMGSATVLLSGCPEDSREFKFLEGLADQEPAPATMNQIYTIDGNLNDVTTTPLDFFEPKAQTA